MLEYMLGFFSSCFANPSLLGIGLAIAFGAIWFTPYWTPILKKPWAWAVLVGSAVLSLIAVTFIQIPLYIWAGQALNHFWSQEVLLSWILLAGIPQILVTGLVQEGSKLVPVVVYWWRSGKSISPGVGLALGAVAGVGLGIFEAVWVHNSIFASGWTWAAVQTDGLIALAGFWGRFFTIAFHTASCAIAGWGLAKGWGWQFYLLAAFLHAILNYSAVLIQSGVMTATQLEIFIAVWAVLVTGGALWLRWRKSAIADEEAGDTEDGVTYQDQV